MRESDQIRREQENEDAFSGKPRAAYHRFFEGYTEAKVPRSKNRGEIIIRRYTAPWKQPNLDRKKWIVRKITVAGMTVTAVILALLAVFYGASAHNANYIAFFEMLTILSMVPLIMALLTYLAAGYQMTLWEYKSGSKNLLLFGAAASVLTGLTGAAILVHSIVTQRAGVPDNLLSAAAAFCACVLLIFSASSENRVEYLDIPNHIAKPENGSKIWLE